MYDFDYADKLREDMPHQFLGKQRTEALLEALADQLEEVQRAFSDLLVKRTLDAATGAQLDGIGDIVCLSRTEALQMVARLESVSTIDDDAYRNYLKWKIFKNTSSCTYREITQSIRAFWTRTDVMFAEKLTHPATIFLTTEMNLDDNPGVEVTRIFAVPQMKAAGVRVVIEAVTLIPSDPSLLHIGGAVPASYLETPMSLARNTYSSIALKGLTYQSVADLGIPYFYAPFWRF